MDARSRGRLFYEAAEQLGWSDPIEISALVKRLERGLPSEDELCAIFHWLGKCQIVHKLDQFSYPPGIRDKYQIPDLLAMFDVNNKKQVVLIEVKTSTKDKLSWKSDYLSSLQQYAALLRLPLLIAWKHRTLWTLFEPCHFRMAKKNWKITFLEAIKQNLLGILAGDFSFSFKSGTAMHIKMRKLNETNDGFDFIIDDAYFLNADGSRDNGAGGLMHLFLCIDQEPSIVETKSEVIQSFVIKNSNQAEFAHRALVNLLGTFTQAGSPLIWRQVLLQNQISKLSVVPRQAAKNALAKGFLDMVINYKPALIPGFLSK